MNSALWLGVVAAIGLGMGVHTFIYAHRQQASGTSSNGMVQDPARVAIPKSKRMMIALITGGVVSAPAFFELFQSLA